MKWKLFKVLSLIIIIIASVLIVYGPKNVKKLQNIEFTFPIDITASDEEGDYTKEYELSMVMVGDALIHSAVYADAATGNGYDFTKMFTE